MMRQTHSAKMAGMGNHSNTAATTTMTQLIVIQNCHQYTLVLCMSDVDSSSMTIK
jgi:hypothetical protein